MKNFFVLFSMFIILSSCSSDDNTTTSGNLIGTWIGVSSTFNGINSGVPDNNIVKFSANNRVEFVYEGFGNNGEDISDLGNWSKSGNTLTIEWDDADQGLGIFVLTITELSQTTLLWKTTIQNEGELRETFTRQ